MGTVTAAAHELHVSQPALSRSLVRLEGGLGHPLFDRPGRRLVLNAAGRAALEHAEVLLREARAIRPAVDDAVRRSAALQVGTVAPAPSLAKRTHVGAEELDGETFLLFEDIGFWRGVCDDVFPFSQFVVQQDRSVLERLAATSDRACFVTDAPSLEIRGEDRVVVPIRDAAAHATFFLLCREGARTQAREVFAWALSRAT